MYNKSNIYYNYLFSNKQNKSINYKYMIYE